VRAEAQELLRRGVESGDFHNVMAVVKRPPDFGFGLASVVYFPRCGESFLSVRAAQVGLERGAAILDVPASRTRSSTGRAFGS
jgi:hypothetical protein